MSIQDIQEFSCYLLAGGLAFLAYVRYVERAYGKAVRDLRQPLSRRKLPPVEVQATTATLNQKSK